MSIKFYDVTVPIRAGMFVYPGDPQVEITPFHSISEGAGANVTILRMGSHTGTHVDPPFHTIQDGATVDQLSLDILIGECLVRDMGNVAVIDVPELERVDIPNGTERLLFKTRNSEMWKDPNFREDYTYLHPDAADWLVRRGVRLVGVDYLSVEGYKSGAGATHRRLLSSGAALVEGLDLSAVPAGNYTLICLPMLVVGGDGAPARVVLAQVD